MLRTFPLWRTFVHFDSPTFPGFSFLEFLKRWSEEWRFSSLPFGFSICRLAAVALCALLIAGLSRCAAQSTTPDSHAADTQSDKPREGGQAPAVGGVNTGGAHPAVLDSEHRPITAGGFVKEGPVIFEDIARQAGLTYMEAHHGHAGETIHIEANGSGVGLIDYDNSGCRSILCLAHRLRTTCSTCPGSQRTVHRAGPMS